MAMGRREEQRQDSLFVATAELPSSAGHPFYEKLNDALRTMGFDRRFEKACEAYYDPHVGRRGIPPGVYVRMLLIGYFEGIDSERGIAWRVADSLSLRRFLGYGLSDATPDHSSLTRVRQRLPQAVHDLAFELVLRALAQAGLVKGRAVGVDATTLEANAALRSIVRKDTGQSYDAYLDGLAEASGVAEPTREDRAKLDRKRAKKGSNDDWEHPHDPDAKITKMKDGRTHLAHKVEHVVDITPGSAGALLGVSLHPANQGDTSTGHASVDEAFDHLSRAVEMGGDELPGKLFDEVVADKGYHSNQALLGWEERGMRPGVSEPGRGRRRWKGKADAKRAVYNNRRRVRSDRGRQLQRDRGEKLERSNAHLYETGGMRRTHLRGHDNILKRLTVHAAGFNLSLLMRAMIGIGKPRAIQGLKKATAAVVGLQQATLGLARTRLESCGPVLGAIGRLQNPPAVRLAA